MLGVKRLRHAERRQFVEAPAGGQLAQDEARADRIGLLKVAPGPLPFPPGTFDVVFSKDSIVHIPDKAALMAEVFRVLH